ncbi:lectin subunit alpha-like [Cochliomyia hominivorax]
MRGFALRSIIICFLLQITLTKVVDRKWYKTCKNKMYYIEENYQYTWYEAFLQCSMKKLSLVTLETEEEHEDLAEILSEEKFTFNAPHLWVGAVGNERQFSWVANSQPVFTLKWIAGNPDNYNKEENCLHFWENTTNLNDRKCDLKYGYICEDNNYSNELDQNSAKYKHILFNVINHG